MRPTRGVLWRHTQNVLRPLCRSAVSAIPFTAMAVIMASSWLACRYGFSTVQRIGSFPFLVMKRVLALKQYGSDVRFMVYPDAGHDICDQAYSTPELFNWILKQRRRSAPAAPAVKVTPKGEPVTLVATSMTLTKAEVMPLQRRQ